MNLRQTIKVPELLQKWIIIGVVLGVVAGLSAIAFFVALDTAEQFFTTQIAGFHPPQAGESMEEIGDWTAPTDLILLIGVITFGGLLCGLLVYTFAPEAEGHGTDAAIASFHRWSGLVKTRIPFIKMISSAIVIGSGGSGGREGPTAQISAGVGSLAAKALKLSVKDRRIAVAVGIGAGIGSIFKAPLGGALLASEILYKRDFESDALIPGFVASTVGYVIFATYDGYEPTFAFPDIVIPPAQLPFFALNGLICGIAGIAYVSMFYRTHNVFTSFFKRYNLPRHLKPALGMFITGLLAVALITIFPQDNGIAGLGVLGMGYGFLQMAMYNMLPLQIMFIIGIAKILSTSLTIGSGGSAGVFAPGLVIGGMIGGSVGVVLNSLFPEMIPTAVLPAFVAIGMIALFGGVANAPISVMIMICEMTGNYSLFLPAMVAVAISYLITGKRTIYVEQMDTKADSPAHRGEMLVYVLENIKVDRAMVPAKDVISVSPLDTVLVVMKLIEETGHIGYPVIENGELIGIIAFEDVEKIPVEERSDTRVSSVMTSDPVTIYPDDNLEVALRRLVKYDIGRLPVVERGNEKKLVGFISRPNIIKAHARELLQLRKK